MTRQDKATILFALEYLKANFDDCQELLAGSIFFTKLVGNEVGPPQSADEVQVLIQKLIKEDRPPDQVKLSFVLRDDNLPIQKGSTLQDVLDAGGELIDESMEPPVVPFMVEEDDHWFAGSVEMAVHEANPALVCDEFKIALDTLDLDNHDNDKEIAFLEAELNKLPSCEHLLESPPDTDLECDPGGVQ
jgi:hypothetical protein